MPSLRLGLISVLLACLWDTPYFAASLASSSTLQLNASVTLDLLALPGSPTLWMGRTPVTVGQFRTFVEATGYRTDAENPEGNGPGRVGGTAGMRNAIALPVGGRNTHGATRAGR